MVEEHTLDFYRDITWFPKTMERRLYATWKDEGCLDMRTRVHNRTKSILANHKAAPLADGVREKIDAVIEQACKRVAAMERGIAA